MKWSSHLTGIYQYYFIGILKNIGQNYVIELLIWNSSDQKILEKDTFSLYFQLINNSSQFVKTLSKTLDILNKFQILNLTAVYFSSP